MKKVNPVCTSQFRRKKTQDFGVGALTEFLDARI
jgi:hypothetical protein